jgi:hypothetical protein
MRRSTVLNLPLQLVFPATTFTYLQGRGSLFFVIKLVPNLNLIFSKSSVKRVIRKISGGCCDNQQNDSQYNGSRQTNTQPRNNWVKSHSCQNFFIVTLSVIFHSVILLSVAFLSRVIMIMSLRSTL